MSWYFVDRNLRFTFNNDWRPILHWDRHLAYQKGMGTVDGGKSVDIIGMLQGKLLMLMEVKDYRLHPREKTEAPAVEFEKKVRCTVAAIVGARRSGCFEDCNRFCSALLDPSGLKLVLWIEEPRPPGAEGSPQRQRSKVGAGVDTLTLREKLSWLHANRIITCNLDTYRALLPGVEVEPLRPERRERAEKVVRMLEKRFPEKGKVPDDLKWQIHDCIDLGSLDSLLERAQNIRSPWELFHDLR